MNPAEVIVDPEIVERDALYRELDGPVYSIVAEEPPVSLRDCMPSRIYRFDGAPAHSGDHFRADFERFAQANQYLIMDNGPTREFADGFGTAVAMVALYLDSLELYGTDS